MARDHVEDGSLASPVLTDQTKNFPRIQLKREIPDCDETSEALGNVLYGEE